MEIKNSALATQAGLKVEIKLFNKFSNDELYQYFITTILEHKSLNIFREKYGLTYLVKISVQSEITLTFEMVNSPNVISEFNVCCNNLEPELKLNNSDIDIFKNQVMMDCLNAYETNNISYLKFWNDLLDINSNNLQVQDYLKYLNEEIYWDEDFEDFIQQDIIIKEIEIK